MKFRDHAFAVLFVVLFILFVWANVVFELWPMMIVVLSFCAFLIYQLGLMASGEFRNWLARKQGKPEPCQWSWF